jgi:hypothetical protein
LDSESGYTEGSVSEVSVVNGETTTLAEPIQLTAEQDSEVGSISGDVTNDIVATVTVKDKDSGDVVATMDSNASGEFLLEDIPVGTYTVTVSAAGFVSQDYTKDDSTDVIVASDTETVLDAMTLVAE